MKQYKVGDKVTIRSWESMEREFGLNEYGNICSPRFDFVKPMADFCGLEAVIEEDIGECYHIKNGRCYAFTPQMFTDWEKQSTGLEPLREHLPLIRELLEYHILELDWQKKNEPLTYIRHACEKELERADKALQALDLVDEASK